MKKYISLLLVLSLVFLTACANEEIADSTPEQTADTTQTTETTTASEQASETTTEKQYVYETEIRETEPLQTESPELQEKIDRNQEKFPWIANKIVVEIGEMRYAPYLMQGHYGMYFDEKSQMAAGWMGGGTDGRVHADKSWLDERIEEVWHIHQEDTFRLYKNDIPEEKLWFTVLDYSEDENNPTHRDYYDFSTMCETLGSGTHYVYTQVRCEGDHILINGERGETEYADFLIFFILEIE